MTASLDDILRNGVKDKLARDEVVASIREDQSHVRPSGLDRATTRPTEIVG